MLNETKRAHIRRQVLAKIGAKEPEEIISFEIARREDTVEKLDRQRLKEREEIAYLSSLVPEELTEEVREREDDRDGH